MKSLSRAVANENMVHNWLDYSACWPRDPRGGATMKSLPIAVAMGGLFCKQPSLALAFGGADSAICKKALAPPRLFIGRDDWIRTSDPYVPNVVRYRTALHPVCR